MDSQLVTSTVSMFNSHSEISSLLVTAEDQIQTSISNTPDLILTYRVPDFANDRFLANTAESIYNLNIINQKLPTTFQNYKKLIGLYHIVLQHLYDRIKQAHTETWHRHRSVTSALDLR